MKLTLKDDPERIKRFAHIKPAPRRGPTPCSAECPGTLHICTLKRGHSGPHVAHGRFSKVVAVWDKELRPLQIQERTKRVVIPPNRNPALDRGLGKLIQTVWEKGLRREHFIEEAFLLVFAVAMVWFVVDMALHILGWR